MHLTRFFGTVALASAIGLLLVPSASGTKFTDESFDVPQGVVGQYYGHRFEGRGGCGPVLPYQFRVLHGELPPGLSLTGDGLLVGIPRQAGSWSFWLELSDEDPPSEPWCLPRKSERRFTVDVISALVVTTESAPPATVGASYSLELRSEGGSGTRAWSIASGRLPPGLTLGAASGAITGSPTAAGVYQFRVRVSDGSRMGSKQLTISVREPLAAQAPAARRAEVGVPIPVLRFSATGGSPTKTWRLEGILPRGLSFDADDAAITGTPMEAGSFPLKLVVADSEGRGTSVELTIVVSPRLTIAPTRLAPAQRGRLYRATIRTLGGVGSTRFRVQSGRVPAGLRLDSRTGALVGRPRATGTFRVVIEARDTLGAKARRAFLVTVRT